METGVSWSEHWNSMRGTNTWAEGTTVQATAFFLGRNIHIFSLTSTKQNPYHVISGNMDSPDSLSPGEPLIIGVKNDFHFQSMHQFTVNVPNVPQASQHLDASKLNKNGWKTVASCKQIRKVVSITWQI